MNICGEKGARNGSFLLISYTNTNEQYFIFIFFGIVHIINVGIIENWS